MLSKPIQKLADFFLKFPGVGPKQAARFAFYLLREDSARARELAEAITKLHEEVKLCRQCYKTYDNNHASVADKAGLCEFCRDARRDKNQIMVVEKEVDLENIERTHKFGGLYHLLGGTISPLDSSAPIKLHLKDLFERVRALAQSGGAVDPVRDKLPEATAASLARGSIGVEVILATNPTADGDATALYLERVLGPLKNQHPAVKISRLGRGLTTGSELEYSDEVTITNALLNRK